MGSSNDTVHVDAQSAANGIGGWELATKSFDTRYKAALQAVNDAHAKTPWGSDEPGQSFKEQYTGTEFPTNEAHVQTIEAIRNFAANARQALALNVQADEDQGTRIDQSKNKVDSADPGAASGGGGSGGSGSSGAGGAGFGSGAGSGGAGGSSAVSSFGAGSSGSGGGSSELGAAQFASSVGSGQGEFVSQIGSSDETPAGGNGEWASQADSPLSGAQLASFASGAVGMPSVSSVGQPPADADKGVQPPSLTAIANQVASLEQELGLSAEPSSDNSQTGTYAAGGAGAAAGSGISQSSTASGGGGGGPTITTTFSDGASTSPAVASPTGSSGGGAGGPQEVAGPGSAATGPVANSASTSAAADSSDPPAGPGAPMAPPMSPGAGGGGGPMPGAGARSHGDPERRQRSAAYGDEDDSLFTTGTPAATLPVVRSAERSVPQQELLSEDHFGVTPSTPPVAPAEPAGPPTDDQPDAEPEAVEAQSGSQPPRESALRRAH